MPASSGQSGCFYDKVVAAVCQEAIKIPVPHVRRGDGLFVTKSIIHPVVYLVQYIAQLTRFRENKYRVFHGSSLMVRLNLTPCISVGTRRCKGAHL